MNYVNVKPQVFQGLLGQEKPVTRKFAADWIRASRDFGCECFRVRVRSARAVHVSDGNFTTQFIIRHTKP